MKFQIVLGFAAQAFAVAINSGGSRTTGGGIVITRPFDLPPFPTKRAAAPAPAPYNIELPNGTPDPDQVQIVGLTYGGTGCPSDSVSSILSDDRTVMTLIFDQYVAEIGPDVDMIQNRKNCQLNINLRYPGGFQYSVFAADYRGYAYLSSSNITGVQKSTYYFSGQTDQVSTQTTWEGPMDEDYLIHDEADSTSTVWSPCGQNGAMNINSQIRLTSIDDVSEGLLTNDSVDTSFRQIVHVRWQECMDKET